MSLAKALYARWRILVHELAKFGIVGAINTVVHFGLLNVMAEWLEWRPLIANGVAMAVAATSSYFMNREWTFRHRARSGLGREYSRFFVLNGVGWLIAQACVAFTTYVLDMRGTLALNAAVVAGVGLGTFFRFLTYKRWVFLASDQQVLAAAGSGHSSGPKR